jgi:hypothetical protein
MVAYQCRKELGKKDLDKIQILDILGNTNILFKRQPKNTKRHYSFKLKKSHIILTL